MRALLQSISSQTTLPDEVVFCDTGSSDGTIAAIRRWSESAPFPVRVIVAPGVNIAQGRNRAISAASSPVIAVTDGGCELHPEWLDRITSPLVREDGPFDVAYGATIAQGRSAVGQAFAALHSVITNQDRRVELDHSANSVAFTKDAWKAAGGFPEWLTLAAEDTLFFLNLRDRANSTVVKEAYVRWQHGAESLGAVYRMHHRNSIGQGEASMWSCRYAVLTGLYALVVLGYIASLRHRRLAILATLLAVMLAFRYSIQTFRRHFSLRIELLLPLVVLTRDWGMISGFAIGLSRRRGLDSFHDASP